MIVAIGGPMGVASGRADSALGRLAVLVERKGWNLAPIFLVRMLRFHRLSAGRAQTLTARYLISNAEVASLRELAVSMKRLNAAA